MSCEETIFSKLGGADGIERLVQDFYRRMDTLDDARQIRELHPADLTESIEKLRDFLIGWTGGPPAYVQKHGHPDIVTSRWAATSTDPYKVLKQTVTCQP